MTGQPDVQIIGAYPLYVTDSLFEAVLSSRYGDPEGTAEEQAVAIQRTHDELDRTVLFEVVVRNRDSRFTLDDFGQPGSDQAAYMERYLSPDRMTVLPDRKPPEVEPLHLVFYLHLVHSDRPLRTSYGDRVIPAFSPMPSHLLMNVGYDPIGS